MKKFLIYILITIPTLIKAQNTLGILPETDKKVIYESTVDIPGKSKTFLFNAANKWMSDSFREPAGGIQSADKEQGQIIGKGAFYFDSQGGIVFNATYPTGYFFQVQIDCKDGRYRLRLYNIFTGRNWDDKNLVAIESKNNEYIRSKNKGLHQNVYNLNEKFKSVMSSLEDSINKAIKDEL